MFLIKYYYLEMRTRFYYCILAFFLVFVSVYIFIDNFFYLLIIPVFIQLNRNINNDLRTHEGSTIIGEGAGSLTFPYGFGLGHSNKTHWESSSSSVSPIPFHNTEFWSPSKVENLSSFTNKFIFTDISEAFQTSISLSIFISLFLIVPFILYNIWSFVIPSLYNFERQKFTSDCISFFLIFIIATYFSINVVFPFFWEFFLNFQEINNLYELECQPRISSYISFLFYIIFLGQVLCLFPFFFFLLLKYHYLNIQQIIKKRSIIYLTSFLVISFLSPPEITSQFLLFFICIFFFEISISIQLILRKF
jgi:sec-independent protein translocase protein TatC